MKRQAIYLRKQLEEIRNNKLFELVVISIIIISALLIGAKTYQESNRWDHVIYLLDWCVTVFFLVEIVIRLLSERRMLHFFKNGWNVFDFFIVTVSLIPIGYTEMILIARLLRVFRILRLISIVPELRILLSTLVKSLPRISYVALMMFIIFYIYGAIGSFLFHEVDAKLWGNISLSMLTLFQVATFESWATAVLYPTMEHYAYSWIYFLTFIFINAFVFLNMMIGIVLDVMQKESATHELDTEDEGLTALSEQLYRIETKLNKL